MVRKYVRKTSRASYPKQDLETAIQKVRSKELTNSEAAKKYRIPASTLSERVNEKTGVKSKTLGRPTAIPHERELELASDLRTLEKWGFSLSKEEVQETSGNFVNQNELTTPFKGGFPGDDWFINFKSRHDLSVKKAQSVEAVRKKNTDPFIIYDYFEKLQEVLSELKLETKPDKIWNLDETSVCMEPSKTKVVGAKGKRCTRTTAGSGKENVTVLTTVNACGKKLAPLIIFKGKNVYV